MWVPDKDIQQSRKGFLWEREMEYKVRKQEGKYML